MQKKLIISIVFQARRLKASSAEFLARTNWLIILVFAKKKINIRDHTGLAWQNGKKCEQGQNGDKNSLWNVEENYPNISIETSNRPSSFQHKIKVKDIVLRVFIFILCFFLCSEFAISGVLTNRGQKLMFNGTKWHGTPLFEAPSFLLLK